jgi:hypothetical protein
MVENSAVTLFVPSGGSVRAGAQPACLPHQTGSRSRSFCPPHDAKHVSRYKYRHSQFGVFSVLEVFWIHIPQIFVPTFIAFGIIPCNSGFSGAMHEEVWF